ncbi:MAG: PAS domain-containing protein, partial [Nodosilinea sp.]
MASQGVTPISQDVFAGQSKTEMLLRSRDWSQTTWGEVADWPDVLKATLSIVFGAGVPAVCVWGSERRVFYNDACAALLPTGWQVGQPLIDMVGWDTLRVKVEQVLTTGRSQFLTSASDRGSLASRYSWSLSAVWHGADVEGTVAIGVPRAQNERSQAGTLQESEKRFRHLADNISQLAWMADAGGAVFWYNQRWFSFTGTTLEQTQGWGWQRVHHPDHVERVVEKVSRCFAAGEIWEDTFPLRDKDGQYRWFLCRATPIHNEQGHVLRWVGTNTDITELRTTEKALEQVTERLSIALKSAPITLFAQDRELRYTWVHNPTHSYSNEQVIGRRDEDLVSTDAAARLGQLKRQVIDSGASLRAEVQVDQNVYDLTIDPIRDRDDRTVGISGAAVDISDRARLEAERKRAEERLRRRAEQLRMAQHAAGAGLWAWDMVTDTVTWSEEYYQLHGVDRSTTPSYENWLAFILPVDRARVDQETQAAIRQKKDLEIDFRIA